MHSLRELYALTSRILPSRRCIKLDLGYLLAKRFLPGWKCSVLCQLFQPCDFLAQYITICTHLWYIRSSLDACDNCFGCVGSSDPFKPPVNLLTCASCKRVKYCSKASTLPFSYRNLHSNRCQGCQRAAWRRYHKQECRMYVFLLSLTHYPSYPCLVARR